MAQMVSAKGHCFDDWESADGRGHTYAMDALMLASQKTGLSLPLLIALAQQESGMGKNIGSSGAGIADAHPSRDAPLFWIFAEQFGYDPKLACASRRPGYGWGGAIGVTQVIPSTFAELNGYTVVRSKTQFSARIRRGKLVTTANDVRIVQWFLNRRGYRLAEDGRMGKKTRSALADMQKRAGFSRTVCQKEIGSIGGCTRAYIAVKGGLVKISYNPRRDKVRKFYGLSKPVDPWSFQGSMLTGAYYLKKLYDRKGRGNRILFSLGAYYAGPGGSWKRGQGYANSVIHRAKLIDGRVQKKLQEFRAFAISKGFRPVYRLERM